MIFMLVVAYIVAHLYHCRPLHSWWCMRYSYAVSIGIHQRTGLRYDLHRTGITSYASYNLDSISLLVASAFFSCRNLPPQHRYHRSEGHSLICDQRTYSILGSILSSHTSNLLHSQCVYSPHTMHIRPSHIQRGSHDLMLEYELALLT